MENKLQEYNGMWWMYQPFSNRWVVADKEDFTMASVCYVCADRYRIDEAFNYFKKEFYGELF